MKYEIYFDESNKLDQPDVSYSYYGAYGASSNNTKEVIQNIRVIMDSVGSTSELHFVNYKKDTHIKKYFTILSYLLSQDFLINIFIVNNEQAKVTAEKMNINIKKLRELFYVKIPERLFYGITRDLDSGTHINIYVDQNDEYEKMDLYNKLREQMNAHSAYRNKCYKILEAIPLNSEESIPLQLIDTIIGITVFLLERGYSEQSDIAAIKSDLIYRLLIEHNHIEKFQQNITLYRWDQEAEQVANVPISEYLSRFLVYKTQLDGQHMNRLRRLVYRNPDKKVGDYRRLMDFKNTQHRIIQGYLDEILHNDRNKSLR